MHIVPSISFETQTKILSFFLHRTILRLHKKFSYQTLKSDSNNTEKSQFTRKMLMLCIPLTSTFLWKPPKPSSLLIRNFQCEITSKHLLQLQGQMLQYFIDLFPLRMRCIRHYEFVNLFVHLYPTESCHFGYSPSSHQAPYFFNLVP